MPVMKISRLTHLTPRICSAVETSMSSSLNIARRWDAARWAPIPLRLIVGYGFMAHGYAKLMKDPDVFVGILHAIGVPAPHVMAWLTILVELLGGLAILLGAFVPLVSLPMVAVLLVAIFTVHLPYCFNSGLISQYTPLACPTTEGPVPKKNAKAQFSPRDAIAPRASGTIWEKPVK